MTGIPALPEIDAILPLGKPGRPPGTGPRELEPFGGRALIDWAAEEALLARAGRILLVAPQEDGGGADAVARHLRETVVAQWNADRGGSVSVVLLHHPAGSAEGWDGAIRTAAAACRGDSALVIDPALILRGDRGICTFTAFMLRRAAQERPGVPLLALADTPWEEALDQPVLTAPGTQPTLSFDRGGSDGHAAFIGRALIPLPDDLPPMPGGAGGWPPLGQFPFEALAARLLAAGAETMQLLLVAQDMRFWAPGRTAAGPAGAVAFPRAGLAMLQTIM